MKQSAFYLLVSLFIGVQSWAQKGSGAISLHPENPHYFIFNGKATTLITSAEHYGAVINLDFDYKKYLHTLAEEGMNYTRIFTGTYFEIEGDFNISNNTLAPKPGRYIGPWQEVTSEKLKYDLSKYNEKYFERLKDFLNVAQRLNIIVEITLFTSIYQDKTWLVCPQNPINNINLPDSISRIEVHTLNNKGLWAYQKALVQKIVKELNPYNNLFYEIQNEPWSDRTVPVYNIVNKEALVKNDWTNKADFADEASLKWQSEIAAVITNEESKLAKKHLIAQNYSNFKASIPYVNDPISIINFHYAWPEAVQLNYHYNKVIGFDESGFAGSDDLVYRRQAWQFMLSGGSLFNNLDYSFSVGNENGKGAYKSPGGGSTALRKQLKVLREYLHSFDLVKLKPNYTSTISAPGLITYTLSDQDKVFAVYLKAMGTPKSTLRLSANGRYSVTAVNTISGDQQDLGDFKSDQGVLTIPILIPEGELALKLVKR